MGGVVGERFRYGVLPQNIATIPAPQSASDPGGTNNPITGEFGYQANTPASYASRTFTPTTSGYLTIQKDNTHIYGIKTYVYGPDQLL